MRGYMEKLSPKILEELETDRTRTRRVIIHAACPSCVMHLKKKGVNILHDLPLAKCYVAELPLMALPVLAAMGVVAYIESDLTVKINLDRANKTVGAYAYKSARGNAPGVTVAVIDTGLYPHPDFTVPTNRIAGFVDLVNDETDPYDDNGHGTFCAGCAIGNGSASGGKYQGIASGADVIMIKAVDENGAGSVSTILRAMQWVADNAAARNIRVLSMSLGVEADSIDTQHDTLAGAAQSLWSQGVTVVAAAGNSGLGTGTINSPGSAQSIITVGAVNDRDKKLKIASFSSRGSAGQDKPDLAAPGVDIVGAAPGGGYTRMSGTSMATPIVAGCAALLIGSDKSLTPDGIKRIFKENALDIGESASAQGSGVIRLAPSEPSAQKAGQ